MNEKVSLKILKKINDLFDDYEIEYWLNAGTLLGAMREGKLIEWEHDIDLAVFDNQISKIQSALKDIRKEGFGINIIKW